MIIAAGRAAWHPPKLSPTEDRRRPPGSARHRGAKGWIAISWVAHGSRYPRLRAGPYCHGIFREPDPEIEQLAHGITMGMMLSVPMLVIGLALVIRSHLVTPRL
jgi:hypothetical protein